MSLRDTLIRHEDFRQRPYLDCCGKYWRDCTCQRKGKLTVGYGRNLDDVGLSKQEGGILLDNDILEAQTAVIKALPWAVELDRPRFEALVNMTFNMGIGTLLKFEQTIQAIQEGSYDVAAVHMLASKWARQVGNRAKELAEVMRTGVDPTRS